MKVSIFLRSFGGMYCAASKFFTSPAMRVGNAVASKCVIGPMPLLPVITFCHAVATSLPTGETMPRPVTTTRRLFMGTPCCEYSSGSMHVAPTMRGLRARKRADRQPYATAQSQPHQRESCARKAQLSGCRMAHLRAAWRHAPKPGSGFDVRLDVIHRLLHGGDLFGFLVGNFGFEFLFERHHQFHGIQRVRTQIVHERGVRRDILFLDPQLIDHDLLDALFDAAHETVPPGTNAFEVGLRPFPTRPARARRARTVQTSIGPVKGLHGDATTVPGAARKSPYYPVYRLRSSLIAALPSGGQTWNSIASSTPERPSMA